MEIIVYFVPTHKAADSRTATEICIFAASSASRMRSKRHFLQKNSPEVEWIRYTPRTVEANLLAWDTRPSQVDSAVVRIARRACTFSYFGCSSERFSPIEHRTSATNADSEVIRALCRSTDGTAMHQNMGAEDYRALRTLTPSTEHSPSHTQGERGYTLATFGDPRV